MKIRELLKERKYLFGAIKSGIARSSFAFKKYFSFPRFNSVKFEISVIYTLILGFILVAFSGIFYAITSRTLYKELDHELELKVQGIVDNVHTYIENKAEKPQKLEFAVEQTIAHEGKVLRRWWYTGFESKWFKQLDAQDLSQDFIIFTSLDKNQIIKSNNLDEDLLKAFLSNSQVGKNAKTFWNLYLGDQIIRVINYPYPHEGEPTHIIQVGIPKGPIILLLRQWMASVLISIPVILVLTGFIGRLLASRILRPLNRIIDTAGSISYQNLNLRVKPKLHYQELDHLIGTFNDMISRLEESFRHIEEFSSHVAHELKTPLTIIRGEAELSLFTAKSQESKKSMKAIIEEIDRILKTIEDMLFLSKTRYQLESFEFIEIDLNKFLKEVIEQFKWIAMGKNIRLRFKKADDKALTMADTLHLRRLFFNLLDNAIKYTPGGGYITVETFTGGDTVRVCVSDTGVGISESNLSRVFDQFFREENKQKGTGLGLSIAQAIAKAHNGDISVQRRSSRGTTFTVVLPAIRSSEPAFA